MMEFLVIVRCLTKQEKGRMATDLKRLKQHFKAYEPTLKELERKYQVSKRGLLRR